MRPLAIAFWLALLSPSLFTTSAQTTQSPPHQNTQEKRTFEPPNTNTPTSTPRRLSPKNRKAKSKGNGQSWLDLSDMLKDPLIREMINEMIKEEYEKERKRFINRKLKREFETMHGNSTFQKGG